jgi:cytochrome c553
VAGQSKSAVCATCHGGAGNSLAPEWPKLAGQHREYLAKQLIDLKSGTRKSPVMGPMAEPLSDADIADLAAYFAAQKLEPGVAGADLVKTGERLYRAGNRATGLPACMACHGPAGAGNPAAGFPSLGGQHAAYTAIQLRAYRSGERGNDRAGMMRSISARITDPEIEAVSSYIQGLHR